MYVGNQQLTALLPLTGRPLRQPRTDTPPEAALQIHTAESLRTMRFRLQSTACQRDLLCDSHLIQSPEKQSTFGQCILFPM